MPFYNSVVMEAIGEPGRGIFVEIPADGVGAVFFEHIHRCDGVALGLGHFLPVLIENQTEDDDVFKGGLIEKQGGNGEQGVKPAAGLVDGFADEVGGEVGFESFAVFKGVVPLGEGHSAGIEPAVDDFGDAMHNFAAFFAGESNGVDIGAV